MAIIFNCKKCGEKIIVNQLKPGEISKCRMCGCENIVPDNLSKESDKQTEENKKIVNKTKINDESVSDNPISKNLKLIGTIMKILGLFVGVFVLIKLSQGGIFSDDKVTLTGVIISLIVIFYHYVSGMVCIGIAAILNSKYRNNG